MYLNRMSSYIPLKSMITLFIIWSYSSYAPAIKNVGFYCNDESIKKPYHKDTIHFLVLLGVLLCVIPFVIYICEVLSRKSINKDVINKYRVRVLLRNYYTGLLLVLGFTEVLKLSYSELRPHFISTCLPDMKTIKCSDGLITDYNCTREGASYLLKRDIYKSFPSGHASLSLYSFVFVNVFIHTRIKNSLSSPICCLWLRSISVVTFIWTVACCVTRILDNRHFWWDVLVGAGIGLVGGIITIRVALKAAVQRK